LLFRSPKKRVSGSSDGKSSKKKVKLTEVSAPVSDRDESDPESFDISAMYVFPLFYFLLLLLLCLLIVVASEYAYNLENAARPAKRGGKALKADSPIPSDSDGNTVSSPIKPNSVCVLFLIIYFTCICIGLLTDLCILAL
jgi:hypothetical protein